MSSSLWPHGLQHSRLPCPSPSPRVCSNSCPLTWWCYLTISSCHPLLLLPSIFPSIRVLSNESALRMRRLTYWSSSFSISPSNEYSGLISFRLPGLISLQSKGLWRVFSRTTIGKHQFIFMFSLLYGPTLRSHPYMTTRKTIALTIQTFVHKVMSLLFNTLSRFVAQLSFNFMAAVTVHTDSEAQENNICDCFYFFLFYLS